METNAPACLPGEFDASARGWFCEGFRTTAPVSVHHDGPSSEPSTIAANTALYREPSPLRRAVIPLDAVCGCPRQAVNIGFRRTAMIGLGAKALNWSHSQHFRSPHRLSCSASVPASTHEGVVHHSKVRRQLAAVGQLPTNPLPRKAKRSSFLAASGRWRSGGVRATVQPGLRVEAAQACPYAGKGRPSAWE
jgi:hypothetical protein